MNINVKAVLNVSQIVAQDMIKRKTGGSIVNISSQASMVFIKKYFVILDHKLNYRIINKGFFRPV